MLKLRSHITAGVFKFIRFEHDDECIILRSMYSLDCFHSAISSDTVFRFLNYKFLKEKKPFPRLQIFVMVRLPSCTELLSQDPPTIQHSVRLEIAALQPSICDFVVIRTSTMITLLELSSSMQYTTVIEENGVSFLQQIFIAPRWRFEEICESRKSGVKCRWGIERKGGLERR